MNIKRTLGLVLAVWALVAFVVPVTASASDGADDPSVYFRPAVRFGSDDRTLYILDFLIPVYRGNKDLLFINTKFTPDDHTAWETNLGIGYRRLVLDDKLVLGGNLFYDHRKTAYGSHFDQLGLGFEAMAEPGGIGLATRFNYYQPLTKAKLGDDFGYVFYGNGIYGAGVEEPMTGFDYEAGIRIPGISNYVETWAYAGGYHFFGCHVPDVNGVSARIEAMPTDFLRLNFEYRNDTVNHDQYYGEVALEVPFSIDNLIAGKNPFEGIGDVLTGSRTLKERMTEPVHRDVDVVVGRDYLSGPDAASNGNLVAGVIFVADDAASGGDGSFENPYNTLADAAGDARLGDTVSIVHVLTGDGTGLAGETFDQDGITIWGAGTANPRYPYVTNFTTGYPTITSTLFLDGRNMTVLGLEFHTFNYALLIRGNAFESGLWVFDNVIYNDGYYGIWFEGPRGIGTPESPAFFANNTIYANSASVGGGIYLESYDAAVYARILNNRIEGVSGGDSYGIYVIAYDGSLYGDIVGNDIANVDGYNEAYGIYARAGSGLFGSISRNNIWNIESNSTAVGIRAYANNGDFFASIVGNRIDDVEAYGNWDVYAGGIDVGADGVFAGSVTDNVISNIWAGNGDYVEAAGIWVESEDGDFTGTVTRNTITGIGAEDAEDAEAYGIYVEAEDADFTGSIKNNTIFDVWAGDAYDDAEAYGIYAYADDDFYGSISGNRISGVWAEWVDDYAEAYGILAEASDNFYGSITGNTVYDIVATDADEVYAYGILGAADDNFYGSISDNRVSGVQAYDADYAEAYGIISPVGDDYYGSIFSNTVSSIAAYDINDYGEAYGIYVYSDDGSFAGSVYKNTISDISADSYYNESYAAGIYADIDDDFTGSIYDNTISRISAGWWPDGISVEGYGVFSGSISGNTITGVTDYYDFADGIWIGNFATIAGSISGNTMTGISSPGSAAGIYFADWYDSVDEVTTSITGNYIKVTGVLEAYGLYVDVYGSLGTAATPLVFSGNSGTVNAPAAYAAYLQTNYPEASNVWIGSGKNGMGDNDFVSSSIWSGNYPDVTGAIWAEGYPTYHYIHP